MTDIKTSLTKMLDIEGAKHAALVDSASGMVLGGAGVEGFDMELAAAGNSKVVKAKLDTMASLGIKEELEDILITIESQYHILRPIAKEKGLFFYLALDKSKASLALARRMMQNIEADLKV